MSTDQWIGVVRAAAWTIVIGPLVIGGIFLTALAVTS